MRKLNAYTEIPYYTPSSNINQQIAHARKRRGKSTWKFVFLKMRNFICSLLAYNCPLNSWRIRLHKWRGVNIGSNVFIGLRVTIDHAYPEYIYLEDNSSLAGNNYVFAHSNPYHHFQKILPSYVTPTFVGKGCWVGTNAMILPGVELGDFSIVSSGAVVTESCEPGSLLQGNPASVVKKIKINRLVY